MEDAASFSGADDNTFSSAFADIYLENPINLQQVDPSLIQDQDLNNFEQQYVENQAESFMEMLAPAPPMAPPIENNEQADEDLELSSEQINDIESNQFAPKTRKQTTWGVRKFKGMQSMQ